MPSRGSKRQCRSALIVEDSLALTYTMRCSFPARGWNVLSCRTTATALSQLGGSFDWVVIDPELAGGDGLDVLRHIRGAAPHARVVLIAERAEPARLASLEHLEPDVVLPRPLSFERLVEACGVATAVPAPANA